MSGPGPIRVIGVGSPLGDDALAWEAVRRLREQMGDRPNIEWEMVEGGQRLLDLLDGQGPLVLIDALAPAGNPGAIHRFEWPDERVEVLRPASTHIIRPAEALRLAGTLGILPSRIIIYGIEGENLTPGQELSPAVAAAIPELVRRIAEELTR